MKKKKKMKHHIITSNLKHRNVPIRFGKVKEKD